MEEKKNRRVGCDASSHLWVALGLVAFVAWTDTFVSEERGEGPGSESISDTLRYINLTEVALGVAPFRGRMCVLCIFSIFHITFFFSFINV